MDIDPAPDYTAYGDIRSLTFWHPSRITADEALSLIETLLKNAQAEAARRDQHIDLDEMAAVEVRFNTHSGGQFREALVDEAEPQDQTACAHENPWFSRTICECGDMHYFCTPCGAQVDPCWTKNG